MKKNILAASITLALCSASNLTLAADEEVMVVTVNRMQQNINDTLADVTIIERAEIEKIQPQSVVDLLASISGIDFVQKGGHSQDASIFMRGANANQTLILIDGIRVGSSTLGQKSISSISTAQIERIEVVKGPRAALWGSDAIGGVIQIFTRRLENGEYSASASFGSNNTKSAEMAVGFGNKTVTNTLTYSKKKSAGFNAREGQELVTPEDDDGFENDSLAIRGDYSFSKNSLLDWVAQADKGVSEFDSSFGADESHYNNHFYGLRLLQKFDDWNHQVAIGNSRDNSVGDAFSTFETRKKTFSYMARTSIFENVSVAAGYEWFDENVEKSLTEYDNTQRKTESFYLNTNAIYNKVIAELAVRSDDVENVARKTTLNVGAGYKFSKNDVISLNFGQGFKAPTFNDLYYPFGGNPDLAFESSDNLELVYKSFYKNISTVTSIYSSKVDDLIQWTPTNGVWSPNNVGSAKMLGADMSLNYRHNAFEHKVTLSYIDAEDEATGEQLIRRAKKRFNYEVSHSVEDFNWFAQAQYVGKRKDFVGYIESYLKTNLGVSYDITSQWLINFKVNDVFNEAPVMVGGYNPIEREMYLTVSYNNF